DAGRHRSAAAPAISAIMAVVSVGIAATMFLAGDRVRDDGIRGAPAPIGHVTAEISAPEDTATAQSHLDDQFDELTALLREQLPVTATHRLSSVSWPQQRDSQNWCQPAVLAPADTSCPFDDHADQLTAKQQAA